MQAVFEKKTYFQLSGTYARGFQGYMPMFHPHGELLYVVKGQISITVDGSFHHLTAGQTAVVFPYLTHSYEDAPDAEAIIILFDPAKTFFDNTLLHNKPLQCYAQAPQLQPILERAVHMLKNNRPKTAIAYVNAALGELLELLTLVPSKGAALDVTAQLLAYCGEHYAEDITVKSVAEALYLSESYVSKLFSHNLKHSFREYINTLRVHKAQSLLENTTLSIAQIMTQCGFQNQSSFNRVFRQICDTSPREYRRRIHGG